MTETSRSALPGGTRGLTDVKGAAEFLRVKPSTIYEWSRQRAIPTVRVGVGRRRQLRFDLAALERWSAQHTTPERDARPSQPWRNGWRKGKAAR